MTPARLVAALAGVAARYTRDARLDKRRRLAALAARPIGTPAALLRLHEVLCFLQAYPDDLAVLDAVDRALATFATRVARLHPLARRRLHDTGVAGTTLDYPFGYPMTRWLLARCPDAVDVLWRRLERADDLDETLALLAAPPEVDAFSEGGVGWRRWLHEAGGRRRAGHLAALIGLLERSGLPEEVRERLFESLALPIVWRLRDPGASRTEARLWRRDVFCHPDGLVRQGRPLTEVLGEPPPRVRRAGPALAARLIDAARLAMATRGRELHAFSHPNPDDVLVAEVGRGLTVALIGIRPGRRLPLEAYYAFLALKNGVPVGYGGGWFLFGSLDWAMNIFPSFRQGESAFLATQVLRVYRRVFGMRTVVIDRYQLGHENPEALASGAFYFYHRLGFRPRDRAVLRVLDAELARRAEAPAYRSPRAALRRLAGAEVYLTLAGGHAAPERRLRAAEVATLVTRAVGQGFEGDRRRALRECAGRVGRALGASDRASWTPAERRAFAELALVVALLPDLGRWPRAARRALAATMRAKGGPSERAYARRLAAHRRLRAALEALVANHARGTTIGRA